MGKHGQLIMGPAGAGKSTYCNALQQHCVNANRTVHIANLDPAAEVFNYTASIDIRDLITVDDVMEEFGFGPNGALVYSMEYLMSHSEWLIEALDDFDDDYVIFDLPGQIELYSHINVMVRLVKLLESLGYRMCAVYLLDSHFLEDPAKFVSGTLQALSAMIHISLPHINVITKMDLLPEGADESKQYKKFFETDSGALLQAMKKNNPPRFHQLACAITDVIDEYNMVEFLPLNVTNEDSIATVLQHIDHAIQYGEDLEPKEPIFDDNENGFDES
jgi:GTPase SAR1 family protein